MPIRGTALLALAFLLAVPGLVGRGHQAVPVGEPVLDPPTVRCLGVYWVIRDDDAHPASVRVDYRPVGKPGWRQGPSLLRVASGPFRGEGGTPKPPALTIPSDAHLFAGSVLLLDPDTPYQLRLTLSGGGGESVQRTLTTRTLTEPTAPAHMVERHVVPGTGGGSGTRSDPFRGLAAAEARAHPGDLFLLHVGRYAAPFHIRHSGEQERPIVWRGAGDGEAVLDAGEAHEKLTVHAVEASDIHDVWFEKLSICNAYSAIRAHESSRIVVRRCHLFGVICGIFASKDETDHEGGFFISDNLIEGIMPWPATDKQWHDLPESRGIWITGRGNVVCYNRIRHCKDGMDLDDCRACVSNDFYNNDVSEMFDDGSEMDGSDRNTRNFNNRYTNVLCGISFQPVYGGPVYAFRNVIYNVRNEPFKLHNRPSGAVLVHNTIFRHGELFRVSTEDAISNCYSRNNLFVGTEGRAINFDAPAMGCDFDFDGFAGWSGDIFLKWNGVRYKSLAEVKERCPIERHASSFSKANLFAAGTQPPPNELTVYDGSKIDVRLRAGSPAIDAGERLPGFSDGFVGAAPDLGALEFGSLPPHYGPRSEK